MSKTDMELMFDLFEPLPRQGPGSDETTRRAYDMLEGLPENPRILDVGCGTGGQTLELARAGAGLITAVDIRQSYLDRLTERARDKGLERRIETLCTSMKELDFPPETFDVVWGEGSIWIAGFRNGLRMWKPMLKKNGYIAVSDVAWITEDPPDEAVEFWKREYPGMNRHDDNIGIIADEGYTFTGSFTLPGRDWTDNCYNPLEKRAELLRTKYAGDVQALSLLDEIRDEVAFYRKYSSYYGYVFYIMRKETD